MKKLILVFGLVTFLIAAEPPVKPLGELAKHKLISSFERALLMQSESQRVFGEAQQAANDYNELVKGVNKAEGYPEGTTFNIDVKTQTVTPQLPKPVEKK